jgi:Cu2+-exporting ATPase
VDVVLFDKTGTLTHGRHAVTGVVATAEVGEQELLALSAAIEEESEHPVARAIVRAADAKIPVGGPRPVAAEFRSPPRPRRPGRRERQRRRVGRTRSAC